jgi:hypothetical protein
MQARLAAPARIVLLSVFAAALLLAPGCGGDTGKFFGTWELDLGMAGNLAQGYSMTMAFRRDGTGTMHVDQPATQGAPATQSIEFEWEIEGEQLVMSIPEAGVTQRSTYEFNEDGTLSLRTGQNPPMKYRRVE